MGRRSKHAASKGLSYRTGPRYRLVQRSEYFPKPGQRPGAHSRVVYAVEDRVLGKLIREDLRDAAEARRLVEQLNDADPKSAALARRAARGWWGADGAAAPWEAWQGPRYVVQLSPPRFARAAPPEAVRWRVKDRATGRFAPRAFGTREEAEGFVRLLQPPDRGG